MENNNVSPQNMVKTFNKIKQEEKNKSFIIKKMMNKLNNTLEGRNSEEFKSLKENFETYLKNSEEAMNEMDNLQEEFSNIMKEQQKQLQEYLNNFNLKGIKNYIEQLKEKYEHANLKQHIVQCENLLHEFVNSFELNNIISQLQKIKDPSRVMKLYSKNWEKEFKAYTNRLGSNKKYKFKKPDKFFELINNILKNDEDSKIFIYSYCKFFRSSKKINNNSIFINEFLRNVENYEKMKEENSNFKTLHDSLQTIVHFFKQ